MEEVRRGGGEKGGGRKEGDRGRKNTKEKRKKEKQGLLTTAPDSSASPLFPPLLGETQSNPVQSRSNPGPIQPNPVQSSPIQSNPGRPKKWMGGERKIENGVFFFFCLRICKHRLDGLAGAPVVLMEAVMGGPVAAGPGPAFAIALLNLLALLRTGLRLGALALERDFIAGLTGMQDLGGGDGGSDGGGGGGGDDASEGSSDLGGAARGEGFFVSGLNLLVRDDMRHAVPVHGGLEGR